MPTSEILWRCSRLSVIGFLNHDDAGCTLHRRRMVCDAFFEKPVEVPPVVISRGWYRLKRGLSGGNHCFFQQPLSLLTGRLGVV